MRRNLVYWFFSKILSLGIFAFFKKIDIVGKNNVPKTGPLIIVSNHPNMAMDPILVSAACGRDDGHYWAMEPLFAGPQGSLLRALGAIPVKRREDYSGNAVNNYSLFKTSYEILDQNKCLFIFPEGKSYTDSKLQPMRTGAVRLVLDYLKRTGGKVSVPILPCGINYARKDKFRSEILVYFDKPIIIPNEVVNLRGEIAEGFDEKQMVQEYTRTMEKRLKHITINARDNETLRLVVTTRRLYVNGRNLSLEQWVKVTRRVSKLYEEHIDKPEMVALKKDIAKYQDILDSIHLRDAYFTNNISIPDLSRFLFTRVIALLIIAPFAAAGALLHSPIYLGAAYVASEKITPYTESKTMVKLGVSAFCTVPLMYTITLLSVLYLWGFYPFLAAFIVLPLLGLAHLLLVEQGVLLGRSLLPIIRLMGLVLLGFRNVLEDIADQRKELIKRINEVIKQYLPYKKNVLPLTTSSGKTLRYDHDEHFI